MKVHGTGIDQLLDLLLAAVRLRSVSYTPLPRGGQHRIDVIDAVRVPIIKQFIGHEVALLQGRTDDTAAVGRRIRLPRLRRILCCTG
ncbi:hypothetical protein GCM10010505_29250 [Kitasatospora aburaviensis]